MRNLIAFAAGIAAACGPAGRSTLPAGGTTPAERVQARLEVLQRACAADDWPGVIGQIVYQGPDEARRFRDAMRPDDRIGPMRADEIARDACRSFPSGPIVVLDTHHADEAVPSLTARVELGGQGLTLDFLEIGGQLLLAEIE